MNTTHIQTIASRLIAARASKQALTTSDCEALQISAREEAYAVQATVWQSHHGNARPQGWKIGNSSDSSIAVCAVMPCVIDNNGSIPIADFRVFALEAEVAVCFARALPPRERSWSREEVLAAIGSAHVAIEIVDPALQYYVSAGAFLRLADSMLHGSFVLGEELSDWSDLKWNELTMQSFLDDFCCAEATGAHPHVDPFALLPCWANDGALPWGGVQAGDVVTAGTWNGMHFAPRLCSMQAHLVDATGKLLGRAAVRFA